MGDEVAVKKRGWALPVGDARCQRRAQKGYEHLPREQKPQCKKYALKGQRYCKKHNANNQAHAHKKVTGAMPRHYKVISRALGARLEEMELHAHEALQLRDELNLVRVSADETVALFSAAYDHKLACEEALENIASSGVEELIKPAREKLEKARQFHDAAAANMRTIFKEVRDTALDAAKVEALTSGKFSAASVKAILGQASTLLRDVCGDQYDHIAKQFELRLMERIKIDVLETTGTLITPDQDAMDMDDTVPRA